MQSIELLKSNMEDLKAKLKDLDDKGDEREASGARLRIRRFADEMLEGHRHSKDAWEICLADCTTYTLYCESHEDYKNHVVEDTIAYIRSEYKERLKKHDFLQV